MDLQYVRRLPVVFHLTRTDNHSFFKGRGDLWGIDIDGNSKKPNFYGEITKVGCLLVYECESKSFQVVSSEFKVYSLKKLGQKSIPLGHSKPPPLSMETI